MVRKHNRKPNRGSTMVEVMVGFTLLTIMLVSLEHIVDVAGNMFYNTVDRLREQNVFQEEYYKKNHGSMQVQEVSGVTFSLRQTDASGNVLPTEGTGTVVLPLKQATLYTITSTTAGEDTADYTIYQVQYKQP